MNIRFTKLLASACLTMTFAASPLALATLSANPITPRQIEDGELHDFKHNLQMAIEARDTLDRHERCLGDYVGRLQVVTADQERALGNAIQRQRESEADVARFRREVEGFAAEAEKERANVEAQRANLERAAQEHHEQAERLQVCRDVFFLFPDICNLGEDVVKQLNWMNDAQADFMAAEPRLQAATGAWSQAQHRLDDSAQQLSTGQQRLVEAQNAIAQTESAIASTKLVASHINEQIQPLNILVTEFSTSINEAAGLNLNEAHWRTLKRLSSEARSLAASLPDFLRATQSALPEEARRSCSL